MGVVRTAEESCSSRPENAHQPLPLLLPPYVLCTKVTLNCVSLCLQALKTHELFHKHLVSPLTWQAQLQPLEMCGGSKADKAPASAELAG